VKVLNQQLACCSLRFFADLCWNFRNRDCIVVVQILVMKKKTSSSVEDGELFWKIER
jgi:hypothetical protein